jgi:predicted HTH domain antitoxin
VLLAMKMSGEQFACEIKLAAAIKLHETGRLSSGAAARIAGIPRTVFLSKLSEYGVDTFRLSEKDLDEEAVL